MSRLKLSTPGVILFWLVVAIVLVFAGWTAFSEPQYLYTPVDGWSRGRLVVETTLREPAHLLLDEAGRSYILYANGPQNSMSIHLLALDASGAEIWQRELAGGVPEPANIRLLRSDDTLHLLWLSEEQIFQTAVDTNGDQVAAIEPVSFPQALTTFDAAMMAGELQIWASADFSSPGLYVRRGNGEPLLLDEEGFAPQLQPDEAGALHAIWQRPLSSRSRSIVYALVPPAASEPLVAAPITEIDFSRARLRGPWFAVAGGYGYLGWTIDFIEDLAAGQSDGQYYAFRLDGFDGEVGNLAIPYRRVRDYELEPAGLLAGPRAALPERLGRRATPLEAAPLTPGPGQGAEGMMALRVSVEYLKSRQASQVALFYWEDGEPAGYQLLTFTSSASLQPALAQNGAGTVALTWLEGTAGGTSQVYFASTAPATIAAYEKLTTQDIGYFLAESLAGMAQSVIFAPFAFAFWSVLPFVLLLLTGIWRQQDPGWRDPAFYVPLLLAIVLFWGGKFLMLREAWTAYVPFSAWVPVIPDSMEALLKLAVPLGIGVVALFCSWYFTHKRLKPPLYIIFVIYAAVDTLLTMSIYGGYLYNAF
ncbi:MAG: hypothetical protein KDE09_05090 [Anaerolineales bacterium]|nr:hypothetical protein [Anaerolineales bacterium]MCB0017144.1 hypothetical protein [Anaerolineales bacterium]MCB8962390.1 hypothetical protein [Ardenticatenales bacterium]